jgi:TPR repeat protein
MKNRIFQIFILLALSADPAHASRCPKGTLFDKNKLRCVPVKIRKKSRNYASLKNASRKKSLVNPTLPKISDYPHQSRKYILRGNTFFEKKLYLRAAGMYQKIPEGKKKKTLYLIWGRTLVLAGEFSKAVPVYENLIINYPDLKEKKEIKTYYNKLSDIAMQEKSCREGFIEDCRKLVKTYKDSCGNSPVNQCFLWALGMEGLKSYNLAGEQYKQLCNRNFAHGCFAMGELFFHGLGVDKSSSEAVVYLKKSCRLNLQKGCQKVIDLKKAKKEAQRKT